MEIQKLTEQNFDALLALVSQLWTDCDVDSEHETYAEMIAAENDICYLAKADEGYIGFIHAGLRKDYVEGASASPVAYVEALFVQPGFQKKGIGKMLTDSAADWGRLKGCKEMASDTEATNIGSIDFHRKYGFTEANRIVCFIKAL